MEMKFRTEYEMKPAGRLLDPEIPVVLMGSCFTENIGRRMRFCQWKAYPNITGTLYNPSSIARILKLACSEESEAYIDEIIRDSIIERDNLCFSWLTDSKCTSESREDTFEMVKERLLLLIKRLGEAQALIVTFGTAWIYELEASRGYVVANCHKVPSGTFVRRRLSVDEIVDEWREVMRLLSCRFPGLRVIYTVSPVRHLKDGFEGNSSSKAILRLACEELCDGAVNTTGEYFPAFELMNDDLRDYRYYAPDMTHPSEVAVEYIWQKFGDRYLSPESRRRLAEGEKATKRMNHRPIVKKGE